MTDSDPRPASPLRSSPADRPTLLSFDDVSLLHNDRRVLDHVNLTVRDGELLVIAGRSGSGKTTLLKLAAELLQPGEGTVHCPAWETATGRTGRNGLPPVAFVRQQPGNQLVAGTVHEEVAFALTLANLDRAEIEQRVSDALRRTGLEQIAEQPPHTLSGGMMQRLAIAAALAIRPKLWLFDEPTAYLDPPSKERVRALAREAAEDGAVVYAASEPAEWDLGDRLLFLHEGGVLAEGAPDQVIASVEFARTGLRQPSGGERWKRLFATGSSGETVHARSQHLPESQEPPSQTVPSAHSGPLLLLHANGLTASRRGLMSSSRNVLKGVDLELRPGECVALIGPAGAGKTTLLEVLAGLTPASGGKLTKAEADRPDKTGSRGIALSFQFPERQFFAETVLEEVAYGPRNRGHAKPDADQAALDALARTGLGPEYADRNPFDLSGGEARRVALAIVLALHPRLLLLDEPTAGLDPVDTVRVGNLIQSEAGSGRAVVVSGHDLDRFAEWCPRWLLMKDGRIVHDGAPSAIPEDLRGTFWYE